MKEDIKVEQKESRSALDLWQFWKRDSQLFPQEIFEEENAIGIQTFPHAVVFVFDGSTKDVINEEDVDFYRALLEYCRSRRYSNVQVVLTMIDKFEQKVWEELKQEVGF